MSHPTSPIFQRQLAIWATSLMTVLCVMGQVAVAMHHFLSRHAACVEHGGEHLVHLDGRPGASTRWVSTEDRAATPTAIGDPEDDHHCTVVSPTSRLSPPPVVVFSERIEVPPIQVVVARLSTSTWQIIALLRLAPKTSPPASLIA